MGQKTVRFSDLSGQLIMEPAIPARIVIHEHPELADSSVEIEALTTEARAIEDAGVPVAIVDIYFPGEDQPRRVAMEADAFDQLATDLRGAIPKGSEQKQVLAADFERELTNSLNSLFGR